MINQQFKRAHNADSNDISQNQAMINNLVEKGDIKKQ